jgi:hypothetical protein
MAWRERIVRARNMGDLLDLVEAIDDPAEAVAFYEAYVAWLAEEWVRDPPPPDADGEPKTPEDVALSNIGWAFGNGMTRERCLMWRESVGAVHPVFGPTFLGQGSMTTDEYFRAGMLMGVAMKMGEQPVRYRGKPPTRREGPSVPRRLIRPKPSK